LDVLVISLLYRLIHFLLQEKVTADKKVLQSGKNQFSPKIMFMKKLTILLSVIVSCGLLTMHAQTRQITGTVVSAEDGSTMPGVTIVVPGTNIGTITDFDGRYSIDVPPDAQTLSFSFVGFAPVEEPIAGRTVIDVIMQVDFLIVDEVVVTALGITRERRSLGYTVQDVQGEALVRGGDPNLMSSLSGKISGLEVRQSSGMPGAPSQVLVRGASSFSADNTPLYVIDGMPVHSQNDYTHNVTGAAHSNRALDIDPNDIESVTVLKGQAAAALYGLRASNGVILITTKRGRGLVDDRPAITFSSNLTMDRVARLPDIQQTYAQGFNGAFVGPNSFSWGPPVSELPDHPEYGGNNFNQPGLFFDRYKGQWAEPVAFNNPREFFRDDGITFNNNINISGATEFGNYSVGFGNTNQSGIIRSTGMDRYTAKMGGDFRLAPLWNVGFAGNYSDSRIEKLPSGNDSWLFTVYGAPPSFDLMGTPSHQEGTFGDYRQISYRAGAVGNNPNWVLDNNHYREATKRFFGNTYIEFRPFDQFNLRYQVGVDQYTTDNANYIEAGTGNLPTSPAQYPSPANPEYGFVAPTGGEIENFGITRRIVNSLLTASYNHVFNEDFSGGLMVGNEMDHNNWEFYEAEGRNFTTPGWNNLNNATIQNSGYDVFERRTVGFFGNLNLDFRNMIFFNATGRQDIVSSMPRDNRTFFYPSVSLAFVFTELGALADRNLLPFGKIRASYAEVGQAADTYIPQPYFITGGATSGFLSSGLIYPFRGITGYQLSDVLYDPNLVPQNTQTFEVGLELRFTNNRVGLDYSYFHTSATDQIFPVPMAGSTGFSEMMTNAGELQSTGHEIVLYANPVRANNFLWDFTINFTQLTNRVIELAEGVESIFLGGYVTPNIRASAGDQYPAIYGDQFLRDDQGRILVNENPDSPLYGMPMAGGFGKIGEVTPDFYVSFINNFTLLRNLSLSAQVDWKQGGQMYSGNNRLMDLYGVSGRTENRTDPFIYDGYKADGTPNDIVRGGENDPLAYQTLYLDALDAMDESQVYETSFVKLRQVALSYHLPARLTTPVGIQRATLSLITRNILLWTTLPNFDPEASQGQGNMQGGMDYMSLPQTTSFGLGLNINF
jgi:TonB-linked SusC/RagA family outer membrane protein